MGLEHGWAASALSAFTAGPHAIFFPTTAYASRTMGNRPLFTLTGVILFTAVAAMISTPVTVHILRTTPGIAASLGVAQSFVLFQNAILTPVGTAVFLLAMAVTVWVFALLVGSQLTLLQSTSIVFIAGVASALKRLFVAIVLYVRWWIHPSSLSNEISTGVDGFIPAELLDSFPTSVLKEVGLFEVWFCVLVAIGLERGANVPRGKAVITALGAGTTLVGIRVLIASLPQA